MLNQEFGSFLIGFTKNMACPHCNNIAPFHIRQSYVKQELFAFVPLGTKKGHLFKVCPVCEKKENLTILGPMLTSDKKLSEVIEMLEGGKELTKQWICKLSAKDKEGAFKRLNALKAFSVVKYCME